MLSKLLTMLIVFIIETTLGFLLVDFISIEILFFYLIFCLIIDISLVEILNESW